MTSRRTARISPVLGLSGLVLLVDDVLAAARFYRDAIRITPETEPTAEWAPQSEVEIPARSSVEHDTLAEVVIGP